MILQLFLPWDLIKKLNTFKLDPQLKKDCLVLGDFPLSQVLLLNDVNFPWLILVPRVAGITEIFHLKPVEQQQLLVESGVIAKMLEQDFAVDKLNVAAIGNIVSQLHLHHIGRFRTDLCWPGVVWGYGKGKPYEKETLGETVEKIQSLLCTQPGFIPTAASGLRELVVAIQDDEAEGSKISRQVGSYGAWKGDLRNVISDYQRWLLDQQLLNSEMEEQLSGLEEYLEQDRIQLAFVGEFSRGKTELINALFFADSGHRLLPSLLGRTTMCPTELFYDESPGHSYLRLLSIGTRINNQSLQYYLNRPEIWQEIRFNSSEPEMMADALQRVAETRTVSRKEALELGFDLDYLDSSPGQGEGRDDQCVVIPAWRHALVNFDHPLLRQGLTILDTPGLNALGCEPDLTLRLLPKCQGVVFMLNADAGVTSSDLQIWEEYISNLRNLPNAGLFAVMNKIDSVWDSLASEQTNIRSIEKIRALTAEQLNLDLECVLPLSAKQGFYGKVMGDDELLHRSQLHLIESILSDDVISCKKACARERVERELLQLIKQSQQAVKDSYLILQEQSKIFQLDNKQWRPELIERVREAKQARVYYRRQLDLLKRSRNTLLLRQKALVSSVSSKHIDLYRDKVETDLQSSWTSLGLSAAIKRFFKKVFADLVKLELEVSSAHIEVKGIYRQYQNVEKQSMGLSVESFDISDSLQKMATLKEQALASHKQLGSFIAGQNDTGKRFLNSVVLEAEQLYKQTGMEAERWLKGALQPLILHTMSKKKLLDAQIQQCNEFARTGQRNQDKQVRAQLAILMNAAKQKQDDLQNLIVRVQEPPLLGQALSVNHEMA